MKRILGLQVVYDKLFFGQERVECVVLFGFRVDFGQRKAVMSIMVGSNVPKVDFHHSVRLNLLEFSIFLRGPAVVIDHLHESVVAMHTFPQLLAMAIAFHAIII